MLPLTADETIDKADKHCKLSLGQSLGWAYSRPCRLCFSGVSTFHCPNQASPPQAMCTPLLSKVHYTLGRAANPKQEFVVRGCTQLLLCNSQANLKFGNRVVACSAPGRILGKASPLLVPVGAVFSWESTVTHLPSKGQSLPAETLFLLSIPGRQEALIPP